MAPAPQAKLELEMELALNLVWVMLAVWMSWLWLRTSARPGNMRFQIVALALLLLILFPVISVTDDLQALQNPAETDACLRRDHTPASSHAAFHAGPPLLPAAPGSLFFGARRIAVAAIRIAPSLASPALAPIQNRPPPTA